MIKAIQAKTLLNRVTKPDIWFGLRYNMNLYRGCQHQCIYCDSRSLCYQINNFNDILVKTNALELLHNELSRLRIKGTIGTGSMNDPYMPLELEMNLTGGALKIIAQFGFPVHIITKSNLVVRDLAVLMEIAKVYAAVSFTITTTDERLGKIIEPGAPTVSERFEAMRTLSSSGIMTGVVMMPILPFIEDNKPNIERIVNSAAENGASYIIPSFGMTLRDRQRAYYYDKLDIHFPGLRQKYEQMFSSQYYAPAQHAQGLALTFENLCAQHGIAQRVPVYNPQKATQLNLL